MARGDRLRSKGGLEAMGMLRNRTRVDANLDQRASDESSVTVMGETPTVERLDGRPMERGVQRSRAGDILKAALAVIIVAAAVGAYAGLRYRPATPAPSHPVLRLVPTNDLLYCITQLAWSPDGRYVAALGNEIPCGAAPGSKAGLIYVYDAQTGKVAQKLHPDALVMGAPAVKSGIAAYTAPTNGPPTVDYFTLTWTPDGQALIMSFSVLPTLAGSSGPSYQSGTGVLRLAVGSRATSAVMIDTLTQFPDGDVERWDLQTGQPAMVPAPPAAAAYQWNSLGALTAIDATPDGPVGAPNSGQRFTVWQPGSLAYQQAPPSSPTGLPVTDTQDILWSANITPISPDGRYYYPLLTANGSLAPPSTQHPFAHEKILAPHDAALQALAQALVGAHSTFPGSLLQLAWRPDGKLLAALYPNASAPVGDSAFTISLYDTATGKLVKRLTPDLSRLQVGESGIETLSWSPDGKRLLLIDNVYGAITIWGPGALPA